jgi:Uma2 family endonuclease
LSLATSRSALPGAADAASRGLWTVDQFLTFHASRPEDERWQLVDGLAMMMVPPTRVHQKLGKNLLFLLDRALAKERPDLEVYYELGLHVPGADDFFPMPDLVVLRAEASFERFADSCLFVAEIISASNTAEMIDRKIRLYQSHPENLYCLTVDQQQVHVALYARDAGWARRDFNLLDDVVELLPFGFAAPLADIYRGTPLAT